MGLEEQKKLIGLRIKNLRTKHNLTQEKFCEKVGVEVSTISNSETFKSCPSFATVVAIIDYFKLEPNDFLDFIQYNTTTDDELDSIIIEYLKTTPSSVKKKIIELLETLNKL